TAPTDWVIAADAPWTSVSERSMRTRAPPSATRALYVSAAAPEMVIFAPSLTASSATTRTSRTWFRSPAAEACCDAETTALAASAADARRVHADVDPSPGIFCRSSAACTSDIAQRIEAPSAPPPAHCGEGAA